MTRYADWESDSWGQSAWYDEPWEQQNFSYQAEPEHSTEQRATESRPAPARGRRRRGAHRTPPPPHSLRGRVVAFALAAGAFTAAGQDMWRPDDGPAQTVEYEALGQNSAIAPAPEAALPPGSPELLDTVTPPDPAKFSELLDTGARYAEELAEEQAAKLRPLFTKFASGTFTSGYGARWGVLHPGVDIAAPIGTPIYAVEDGTVIDAGPAAGFGMWVRVRGDDGTVTVYGHVNTATVSVGDQVTAGDQIATVGNRGESTGPHCHFEVWLNGTQRIDPLPWLATRGISLGPERD